MTSYLSSLNTILSTTTSRYNSLRKNILSNSSEDDTNVDHPDATHVSRVLRAYYTETHRPLPAWLPPDPYKPPPQQQQQPYVSSRPLESLRSRISGNNASDPNINGAGAGGGGYGAGAGRGTGGGLGDIWGDAPAPPAPRDDGSLRRAAAVGNRRAGGPSWAGGGAGASSGAGGGGGYGGNGGPERGGPRPLPSQRAGSYQTTNRYTDDSDSRPGSAASSSGRDRLKARMGSQRQVGGGGGYAGQGGGYDSRR